MIEKILSNLQLTQKDIHIYLALVRLGSSSASAIAKEVGLPRQTVYSILENLIAGEFVEQTDRRGVKHFFADPSKLTELIQKQKKTLDEQELLLEKELPKLLESKKQSGSIMRVQYYEGKEGMKRLLTSILEYYRRGAPKEFRGYGVNKFQEALGDYFYDFAKKRYKYKVDTKLVIGQGADDFGITNKDKAYGRTIKRIDMDPQLGGMYLVGNRVYLFSFAEQVGVMVEGASIAKLLTAVFDDHWKKIK